MRKVNDTPHPQRFFLFLSTDGSSLDQKLNLSMIDHLGTCLMLKPSLESLKLLVFHIKGNQRQC